MSMEEEELEEEEEEEETLVLVELHGVIDSEIFAQESFGKFKMLAVDSERPVLQVENFIFSGQYEHTLGTAVFLEEDDKRLKCDPVFCKKPPRMLRYTCSTNKRISMKRVFVSEKSDGQTNQETNGMTDLAMPGPSQGLEDQTTENAGMDEENQPPALPKDLEMSCKEVEAAGPSQASTQVLDDGMEEEGED